MPVWRNAVQQLVIAFQAGARWAAREQRADAGDWRATAQERVLSAATDGADLERRQRGWDRDEANAYAMADWS